MIGMMIRIRELEAERVEAAKLAREQDERVDALNMLLRVVVPSVKSHLEAENARLRQMIGMMREDLYQHERCVVSWQHYHGDQRDIDRLARAKINAKYSEVP